jgi:hypothetical protein
VEESVRKMSEKAWGMLKHMRMQILRHPAPYVVVRGVALSIGVDPGGSECEGLVHTQRGLCVMGYSSFHETSNICPEIVGKGARMPRSRAALQGDFRDASLPDTARQRPRQLAAQDSRESRVRLADGVRNAIRTFNEKGLDALIAGSSTPKRVYPAFDANSAERLRGMLHRSPREFGYETSLWTLEMAAEAAFEEGLTEKRVSGETIRATLSRLLGIRWQRAKRWITSPDPLYERKKGGASD